MIDLNTNPVPPLSEAEYSTLETSIRERGIITPVIRSSGPARTGDLVDGFHRTAIAESLGIECPITWKEYETETEFLIDQLELNLARRQLSLAQKIMVGMKLDPLERVYAQYRMAGEAPAQGAMRDVIGRKLGIGGTTYERGKQIIECEFPEVAEAFIKGEISVREGWRRMKMQRRRRDIGELTKLTVPSPPSGRYNVIVVDPPWPTEDTDYPTMTMEELMEFPVASMADDNCILFLWVINSMMVQAGDLTRAWGFDQKTVLTWDKLTSSPGWYFNGQSEHIWLCVRGVPTVVNGIRSTVFHAPRREHSRKPDEFYKIVENMCPGTKIDLFARQSRPGWDTWGLEAVKFDGPAVGVA